MSPWTLMLPCLISLHRADVEQRYLIVVGDLSVRAVWQLPQADLRHVADAQPDHRLRQDVSDA